MEEAPAVVAANAVEDHTPVVHRLGFRWPGQVADEGDLDNCKHLDDEHDGSANLRADRGSREHDDSDYEHSRVGCRRV